MNLQACKQVMVWYYLYLCVSNFMYALSEGTYLYIPAHEDTIFKRSKAGTRIAKTYMHTQYDTMGYQNKRRSVR
jgi:hypothetical protein